MGGFLGLAGILLISGPFLRESVGEQPVEETTAAKPLATWRLVLEIAVISFAVVALLHFWIPLKVLHLFEGDYLASFFLLSGLMLFSLHGKRAQRAFPTKWTLLLGTAFSAFVLFLLITGWLQLTITGSWLTLRPLEAFSPVLRGRVGVLVRFRDRDGESGGRRGATEIVAEFGPAVRGVDGPELWRNGIAQWDDTACPAGPLFSGVVSANAAGCSIGTPPQRLATGRSRLQCYTHDWILPGDFPGLLMGHHQ